MSSTVIYDGECRFCIARVEQLRSLDTEHAIEFVARQDPSSEERFPALKKFPLDDGIVFISSDGRMSVAADAMYEIARLLPHMKRVAWLYNIPILRQMIRIGYRLVAINRRRLGQTCQNNVCTVEKH